MHEDAVEDGQRGRGEASATTPQQGCARDHEPNGRNVRRDCGARNVVAPSLKGLIGWIEFTPNEVRDAVGDRCDAKEVNTDSHDRATWGFKAAIVMRHHYYGQEVFDDIIFAHRLIADQSSSHSSSIEGLRSTLPICTEHLSHERCCSGGWMVFEKVELMAQRHSLAKGFEQKYDYPSPPTRV